MVLSLRLLMLPLPLLLLPLLRCCVSVFVPCSLLLALLMPSLPSLLLLWLL